MCKALYIAFDEPINATDDWWQDGGHVLMIREVEGSVERKVRRQFSLPEVRYLGAHTGCYCGFAYYGNDPAWDDMEEPGRRSVEALSRFFAERVSEGREVELYHCWSGDEDQPAKHKLDVTPGEFGGETFHLESDALYRVRGAAQQGDEADEARGGTGKAS